MHYSSNSTMFSLDGKIDSFMTQGRIQGVFLGVKLPPPFLRKFFQFARGFQEKNGKKMAPLYFPVHTKKI